MHKQGIIIHPVALGEDVDEDSLALACRERLTVRQHHPSERVTSAPNAMPEPLPSRPVHRRVSTTTNIIHLNHARNARQDRSHAMMTAPLLPQSTRTFASSAKTKETSHSDSGSSSKSSATLVGYDSEIHNGRVEDIMRMLSPTSEDESDFDDDVDNGATCQIQTSPMTLGKCCQDPKWQNDALYYRVRRQIWGDNLPSGLEVTRVLNSIERWQQSTQRSFHTRRTSTNRIFDENQPSMGDVE